MKDYVRHIYDDAVRPKTTYPSLLVKYLIDRYQLKLNSKILDLGCGRGDFSAAFSSSKMDVSAIDFSDSITENYSDIDFTQCDFTKENLPYSDSAFDVVFSKSVVEHMYYPENILRVMSGFKMGL